MRGGCAARGETKQASASSQAVGYVEKSCGFVFCHDVTGSGWFLLSFIFLASVACIHRMTFTSPARDCGLLLLSAVIRLRIQRQWYTPTATKVNPKFSLTDRSIRSCGLVLRALPEHCVVGPSASGFSPGKDGEVRQRRNIGFIVDGALDVHRDSQARQLRLPLSDSSCASSI